MPEAEDRGHGTTRVESSHYFTLRLNPGEKIRCAAPANFTQDLIRPPRDAQLQLEKRLTVIQGHRFDRLFNR